MTNTDDTFAKNGSQSVSADKNCLQEETGYSPGSLRISLAAAMTLGLRPGTFYRDARLYCLNLLLDYPEGCTANCSYCGLSRTGARCAEDQSFIRVEWPRFNLEEIINRARQ